MTMKSYDFSSLKNKVCAITGGAGVLGTAICESLASVDVKLAILDVNEENAINVANRLKTKYGAECVGIKANVLDKQSLINAKQIITSHLGPVEILINGAGGNSPKATTQLEQIEEKDLDELDKSFFGLEAEGFVKDFALNFTGTLLPSMVFAEDMAKNMRGTILNISSMNSYSPLTLIL